MTRFELRFALRHPARWVSLFWLHLVVAVTLGTIASAWGSEVFQQVTFAAAWPLLLSWVAGLVVATSISPFSDRLLAVTGAAMMTVGLLRAMALVEVFLFGATAARPVVVVLVAKEGMLFALGAIWPTWTRACAERLTVEAGVDDRGRHALSGGGSTGA